MATICRTCQDRIEKEIWEAVDDWIKKSEQQCKKYPWWNPLGWSCWPGDLMAEKDISGEAMSPFQVGILRSNAPVTFL